MSRYTTATGITDTAAEIPANTTVDMMDPWSAFDAAPVWDTTAPNVDAAQGEKNLLAFLEKSRGYNWSMTKRPTSPGAFGDGERATEARTVVAKNAPIDGASIGDVWTLRPVGVLGQESRISVSTELACVCAAFAVVVGV